MPSRVAGSLINSLFAGSENRHGQVPLLLVLDSAQELEDMAVRFGFESM
jgi:hypothetical protein